MIRYYVFVETISNPVPSLQSVEKVPLWDTELVPSETDIEEVFPVHA